MPCPPSAENYDLSETGKRDLFDMSGRQVKRWTNKLIQGDTNRMPR